MDEMIGKAVGNYRITEEIGTGGMGRVFKAIHLTLDRIVAVKMIHPNLVGNPEIINRFYKEAKIQAQLNHPNIVIVHDFLETEGNYFIIMEYVDGKSVGKIVSEKGPLELHTALSIFRQILAGIRYAHSKGVIHRDVKPNNFILNPSVVKITDFGIAQIICDTGLTATGAVLGTPKYMSPEQILGKKVDHRTDIYSLGVTLYEVLTGCVPFNSDSDSDYEIKRGHVQLLPPLPTEIRPDIPRELEDIVLKALSKKPEDRFQSVDEFIMALEDINIYETYRRRRGREGITENKKVDFLNLNLANIHLVERPSGAGESLESTEIVQDYFEERGRKRLGELLIEAGFISPEQLNRALREQKMSMEKLGQILVRLGYITEDILIELLGKQHGTPSINLYKEVIDERAVYMIPRHVAEKYKLIPVGFKLEKDPKKLIVAMANPSNVEAIDTVSFITGYSIEPIFTREEHLEWIIRHYYHKRWELK